MKKHMTEKEFHKWSFESYDSYIHRHEHKESFSNVTLFESKEINGYALINTRTNKSVTIENAVPGHGIFKNACSVSRFDIIGILWANYRNRHVPILAEHRFLGTCKYGDVVIFENESDSYIVIGTVTLNRKDVMILKSLDVVDASGSDTLSGIRVEYDYKHKNVIIVN